MTHIEKLKEELKKYIEFFYKAEENIFEINDIQTSKNNSVSYSKQKEDTKEYTLDEYLTKNKKNFNDILRTYIRNYNKKNNTKDSDIYKKANIPKEHFNKIINQKIKPQKKPLIALGLALDLTKEEINELLRLAGIYLTNTNKFDLIIMFCLEKNIRDIITINEFLYEYGEDCF